MRLIDANAFKKENERLLHCDFPYLSEMTLEELIDEAPTIDAVQVIRCKDCARNQNNGKARTICPCPMDRYMGPKGYCSKAESKEDDG